MEEEFTEAIDSFGKNVCILFIELSIVAVVALVVAYMLGFINLDFEDSK